VGLLVLIYTGTIGGAGGRMVVLIYTIPLFSLELQIEIVVILQYVFLQCCTLGSPRGKLSLFSS
jgi:hypothetical protein